jgi:uncharacterized membrane protein YeaQ/YmgE (transglycosylase-associated protein family)
MRARLAAFRAKLDIVDILCEHIDETIQLQTMPIFGNIFCGLVGIAIGEFLFFRYLMVIGDS